MSFFFFHNEAWGPRRRQLSPSKGKHYMTVWPTTSNRTGSRYCTPMIIAAFIHNSQGVSTDRWMNKPILSIKPFHPVLSTHIMRCGWTMECYTAIKWVNICYNMDEHRKYHEKWNKLDTVWFHLYRALLFIETEQNGDEQGLRGGGELLFRKWVFIEDDKKILGIVSVDGITIYCTLNAMNTTLMSN